MAKQLIFETKGINKSFGATKALVNVDIKLYRGEVRGLIGENGSGKSTLSSIIAGMQSADSGTMLLNEKEYKPGTMLAAQQNKIGMVVQEMGTISDIRVADNIFLGKESLFSNLGFINKRTMWKMARAALENIGVTDIEPSAYISELNMEQRKLVEIAKAVYEKPDIFIVDETTTTLSEKGRAIVYNLMRRFKEDEKCILFISHDLDELMSTCDCVTVLRDGRMIETLEQGEIEINKMRSLMVGRELSGSYYRNDFDGSYSSGIVLKSEQVTTPEVLENFSMELHKGEILGIGGLTESGMHQIGQVLFGIEPAITGKVTVKGKDICNLQDAIACNIGYVSKNRDVEALILTASIEENIVLPSLPILKNKAKLIARSKECNLAEKIKDLLSIKCSSTAQEVQQLSGGNKQKVAFGKWIGYGSDILILDCPTRGIDIGVKAAMYDLMYKLKKQGKSIIMISEELPELIGMSDRILIMKDGHQTGIFKRSETLCENDIIHSMI